MNIGKCDHCNKVLYTEWVEIDTFHLHPGCLSGFWEQHNVASGILCGSALVDNEMVEG